MKSSFLSMFANPNISVIRALQLTLQIRKLRLEDGSTNVLKGTQRIWLNWDFMCLNLKPGTFWFVFASNTVFLAFQDSITADQGQPASWGRNYVSTLYGGCLGWVWHSLVEPEPCTDLLQVSLVLRFLIAVSGNTADYCRHCSITANTSLVFQFPEGE